MASFPTSKVHRPSRRKLGRGQHVQLPSVTITAGVSTDTVTLTFSVPVIVNGLISYVTNSGHVVTQTQVSPTSVTLLCSATQAAAVWTIAAGDPAISTFQGGTNAAAGGTF
jgi:hypothetical protein